MSTPVTRVPAASSDAALRHFQQLLAFETDCWDVHFAISNGRRDFVLFDVRAEMMYQQGHLPEAISMPYKKITAEALSQYPQDTLFVVYCAGPHCNATEKGAIAIAALGRPVKKMIGGVTGWLDEGFSLVTDND